MADNPVASFLAEFGFAKPDAAGARAVEDLVNRTETRITDVQAREGAKRTAAETKAQSEAVQRLGKWLAQRNEAEEKAKDDRTKAAAEFMGDMLGLDREQTGKLLKSTKEGAAKSVEVEQLKTKKLSQLRSGQFKEASVDLLKFGAIAEKVSGGLASALSIAPFGAFLTGIERGAAGLARLDIQAKRTGSSAAGIQRFLFAMKQQGVDETEATSALEGFASTMKSNPQGYRQALEGLPKGGVRTTGPDGKPLDYDAMLENFGGYLSKQPFNIARMQAGQFGISGDNAIAALQDPAGTRNGLQSYDAKLKGFGFDPNRAAEDARKAQQSWNNLEADFTLIKQKLDAEFFLPFMASLDALAKKMEQNPQAAESFGRGLEALAIGLSARVLPVLANLGVKLAGLGSVLGGSLGAALGIAVNPVVMVGASAESTPTAPVTTDPAERARKLADNTLPAAEMTSEEREAFSKKNGGGLWSWIKGKLGLGEGGTDGDRVKADIAVIAESTKKLADKVDGAGTGGADGGGGGGVLGAARRALGWVATAGGDRTHVSSGGKIGDLSKNPYATKENADTIRSASKELGTTPEDLATVIGYETGGSFSPKKWGGAGGRYMGLIQFGPNERAQYGANENQSFGEQMGAVVRYLKGRGFKPGMGLLDLYSTINAGSPGHYSASDGHGTVSSHVTRMQGSTAALARAFLAQGTTAPAPTPSDAPIGDQAALDAHNRIVAGRGTPADHALIETHRRQQNTPAAAPPVTSEIYDAAKRVAEIAKGRDMNKATEAERRAAALTASIIDRYEKEHPKTAATTTATAPYAEDQRRQHGSGNTLNDLERSGRLDAAHQRLADAMRAAKPASPKQGRAYPGWMTRGQDGDVYHTADMRDPKYAPKPLDVARQKLADAMSAQADEHHRFARHLADLAKGGKLDLAHILRHHGPLGVSPVMQAQINNGRTHNERHGDHFHIHGTEAKAGLDHAVRVSARRGGQDRIRFGQGSQQ